VFKSDFSGGGGRHQQEPEGQYEKSVVHVRVPPGQTPSSRACRTGQPCASGRNLLFPQTGGARNFPYQSLPPLPAPAGKLSPASFCWVLPGTRFLRRCLGRGFRRKRDTRSDRPPSNEPITTDWVEPTIRCRPFVRLTSFGGEGRALDGQIPTMSSASQEADGALKEPRSVSLPTRCRKNFRRHSRP